MKKVMIFFGFLLISLSSINAQTFHFTKMSTKENGEKSWTLINTTWEITPETIFLTMNKKLTTYQPTSTFSMDNGIIFFLGNKKDNSKIILWTDDFGNKVITLQFDKTVYEFR